jgi:hypothetical protein
LEARRLDTAVIIATLHDHKVIVTADEIADPLRSVGRLQGAGGRRPGP